MPRKRDGDEAGKSNKLAEFGKEKKQLSIRCCPQAVLDAAKLLSPEAHKFLDEDLKFGNMLKLRLGKLTKRDLIHWLYTRTQVLDDRIRVHISPEMILEITPDVVQQFLGLPRGSKEAVQLPKSAVQELIAMLKPLPDIHREGDTDKQTSNNKECRNEDKYEEETDEEETDSEEEEMEPGPDEEEEKEMETNKDDGKSKAKPHRFRFGVRAVMRLMEASDDHTTKVRCFLLVLLNRLLMPRTGFYVTEKQIEYAWDLSLVGKMDWCEEVYKDLSSCISLWMQSDTKHNMPGCVLLLMLSFFETVVAPSKNSYVTPRVLDYDTKKVQFLARKAKKKVDGKKSYSNIVLKKKHSHVAYRDSQEEIHTLMKQMAADLYDAKGHVPIGLEERINCTLKRFHSIRERIWPMDIWDAFYQENVLSMGMGHINIVDIGGHAVSQSVFSDCLKPDGWMSSFLMDAQCEIWRLQWPDKIVLSEWSAQELVSNLKTTKYLDMEITSEKMKQANQIFVPFCKDDHWQLVVIDLEKKKMHILDSCPHLEHQVIAHGVLSALELYLLRRFKDKVNGGFSRKIDTKLSPQTNPYDCGFHVLLYIQHFGSNAIYGINEKQISCYRKQLAYELAHDSNNKARDTSYVQPAPSICPSVKYTDDELMVFSNGPKKPASNQSPNANNTSLENGESSKNHDVDNKKRKSPDVPEHTKKGSAENEEEAEKKKEKNPAAAKRSAGTGESKENEGAKKKEVGRKTVLKEEVAGTHISLRDLQKKLLRRDGKQKPMVDEEAKVAAARQGLRNVPRQNYNKEKLLG